MPMPSPEEQAKNRKKMMDLFKDVPVPVPGSSANILENVRKRMMDAIEADKKKKKKGSEGNSDEG